MGGRQASRPVWLALVPVLLAAVILALVTAGCSGSASGAADDDRGRDAQAGRHLQLPARGGPRLVRSIHRADDRRLGRTASALRGPGQVGGAARRHDEDSSLPGRELERERRRDGLDLQVAARRHVPGARVARGHRGRRGGRPAYLADPAHEFQMTYMYMPIKGTDENGVATCRPARRRGPRPLHRPLHAQAPLLGVPRHPRQPGLLGLAGGPPAEGGPQGSTHDTRWARDPTGSSGK